MLEHQAVISQLTSVNIKECMSNGYRIHIVLRRLNCVVDSVLSRNEAKEGP